MNRKVKSKKSSQRNGKRDKRRSMISLSVIVSIVLVAVVLIFIQTNKSAIENVDTQKTQMLIKEGVKVIDVRTPGEYSTGHIPEATLIPLNQLPGAISDGKLDKTKSYILVCASGNRSMRAAKFLKSKGFEKIYNFGGGMLNWQGTKEK